MTYEVTVEGRKYTVELARTDGQWTCKLDGRAVPLDAVLARRDVVSMIIDGAAYEVKREQSATDLHIWVKSVRYQTEVRDPRSLRSRRAAAAGADGPQRLVAPMPGKVVRILARESDEIEAGKGVIIVEAMKMQNEVKAGRKGTVQKIFVTEGASVNAGDVLAIVE